MVFLTQTNPTQPVIDIVRVCCNNTVASNTLLLLVKYDVIFNQEFMIMKK